ncbi:MAG: transglutaminase domain-containing protein [Pygmaiobacter sp.]
MRHYFSLRSSASRVLCGALALVLLAGCTNSRTPLAAQPTPPAQTATPTPAPTPIPTPTPTPCRPSTPMVRVPSADGSVVSGNALASLDASNSSEGYIMVRYTGGNPKVKLQLTGPNGITYTYTLHGENGYETFPLTAGSGSYAVNVFENVGGTDYVYAMSDTISAEIVDENLPYLYPNQYVNFNADSTVVAKGAELAANAMTELDVVDAVYNFVIANISYDYGKAESVKSGYLPVVDDILASGLGICFDYSAVMATMLRTQNIPTRLDVGWAGDIYHAWISVYITDIGWINGIIEFDGVSWKRMDPTFACNGGQSDSIMAFINNSGNYNTKYTY